VLPLSVRWLWRPLTASRGFVVADVRPAGDRASAVVLRPMRGHRWAFRPGQFAWLRLTRSAWAEDHPFSMSSAPGRTVEFTIAHRGDWTSGPLRALRPGRRVWLDGPHGSVTIDQARGDRLVMIAAGVGIAPMLSMLRAMEAAQDGREVRLVVPPVYLFPDEIARMSRRLRLIVHPILSRKIMPDSLRRTLPDYFDGCDVFVCGPPQLVEDMTETLDRLGFPASRVHAERFGLAAELERTGANAVHHRPESAPDRRGIVGTPVPARIRGAHRRVEGTAGSPD
jgi:ferredoxin-NADP reductase